MSFFCSVKIRFENKNSHNNFYIKFPCNGHFCVWSQFKLVSIAKILVIQGFHNLSFFYFCFNNESLIWNSCPTSTPISKLIFSSVWRSPCLDHFWPSSKSSISPLLRGVGLVLLLLPIHSDGHQHLQTGLGLPGGVGKWEDNTTNFYLPDRALLHAEPWKSLQLHPSFHQPNCTGSNISWFCASDLVKAR